ncbi:helix-turn-helix domain-containing protein [Kordia sp. YSTF-M3]|uniref:Helix-turn-helix domain-containing protein n=1 Tax=Kordia aestuariivivens TaxID=2759037 RepID=A0ABR7Q7E5_9FLAO|nr:helix-turn-helix domain-containing protein [Kordia aestuariivivens]MBC8754458.1 helix-turn-helix domain-containing protein [Kordia aestuariivivens]
MKLSLPRFLACLLLLAFQINVLAQEVPENSSNQEIFDFIIQHKYSNPELSKKYARILVTKSKKEQDSIQLFNAYAQCCKIANIEGNYEEAIQYCDSAITTAKALKNQLFLAEVHLAKGNAIVYLGDNKEALANYLNALDIAKQLKDIQFEIAAQANIAKIKRRMGFYEEALSIYKNNAHLAEQYDFQNKMILINAYMGVGGTYLRLQQPDSTLKYSEVGLQKSLASNDMEGVSYFYIDIGIAHFIKGNFDIAIEYLTKAEKITKGLNNQKRLTEIYYYIGKSYFELEKYDDAISFLKNVEKIVAKKNSEQSIKFNPPELLGTYLTLSKAFELKDKRDLYLEYTSKYLELRDANENQDIAVIKELYETARKENNSLSSLTSKLQNRLIYVILFSIFALSLCAYFLFKFLKAKKQNKIIFEQLVAKVNTKKVVPSKPNFTIGDKKVEAILERLDKLEESLFFLNSNCTLQSLAKKVKTNTNYLSKIITKYKHKKFYDYLNDLRIQYVLKRLKEDSKFRNYSVKHIAEEIGYKSTNSFTKYFKAYTKLYPSYYIKNLENTSENNASN